MEDKNGNVWHSQSLANWSNAICTSIVHENTSKKATYKEVLFNRNSANVRVEYTCWPCHMVLLVAAKRICRVDL